MPQPWVVLLAKWVKEQTLLLLEFSQARPIKGNLQQLLVVELVIQAKVILRSLLVMGLAILDKVAMPLQLDVVLDFPTSHPAALS